MLDNLNAIKIDERVKPLIAEYKRKSNFATPDDTFLRKNVKSITTSNSVKIIHV